MSSPAPSNNGTNGLYLAPNSNNNHNSYNYSDYNNHKYLNDHNNNNILSGNSTHIGDFHGGSETLSFIYTYVSVIYTKPVDITFSAL